MGQTIQGCGARRRMHGPSNTARRGSCLDGVNCLDERRRSSFCETRTYGCQSSDDRELSTWENLNALRAQHPGAEPATGVSASFLLVPRETVAAAQLDRYLL